MSAKEKRNLSKKEKAATIIDGRDYWNVKWDEKGEIAYNGDGDPQNVIHAETTIQVEEKRYKRGTAFAWTFFLLGAALLVSLGEFIVLNIADMFSNTEDTKVAVFATASVPLLFVSAYLMTNLTDFIDSENDFFKREAQNVNKSFTVEGVTEEQASDIVSELKRLQKENNVNSYMEIVKKLHTNQEELENKNEQELKKRLIQSEAIEAEKRALRSKTNPFLNNAELSNHAIELANEVKKLTKEEKVLDTEGLVKTLKEIEKNKLNGVPYDKKSYDDCSRELLQVTQKYNETLDSGIKLSDDELKNYQSLVDTCLVVLKRVSDGVIEERSVDARLAEMFIKDKYGVLPN